MEFPQADPNAVAHVLVSKRIQANMPTEERSSSQSRKWRFALGGAVIVLTTVYLVLSSMQETAIYALTIYDLKARCPAIYDQGVRVSGTIDGRTITWDATDLLLEFSLVDDQEVLRVTYRGARPDMFRDGAQALVEGKYRRNGTFEATRLLLKCPSKYQAAATTTATE
jgi:cytochrome c-type biogenesis protein CcmE